MERAGQSTRWKCLCACGNECVKTTSHLRVGGTKTCGECKEHPNKTHGKSWTIQWKLWIEARRRSREKQLEFDLELDDIIIPDICPVLGLKLEAGTREHKDSSPSLDRIDNTKGYIKGNIAVICHRANTIKGSGSLEEHEAIVQYIKCANNCA